MTAERPDPQYVGREIPDDDTTTKAVSRPRGKTARLLEAQRCLELHNAGVEDVRICLEMGISRATLFRRIKEARDYVLDPTVEEYRAEGASRARMARRKILETLAAPGRVLMDPETGMRVVVPAADPSQVASLTTALHRWDDYEAKLRGAYAPVRVDHRHEVRDALTTLLDELEQQPPMTAEEKTR